MQMYDVFMLIRQAMLNRIIREDNWGYPTEEWLMQEFTYQYLPENKAEGEVSLCMVLRSLGAQSVYDPIRVVTP